MADPRPFIIRRDGTLLDRATGATIGRVWLGAEGWFAENLNTRYGPNWTRWTAAREAWEGWKAPPS